MRHRKFIRLARLLDSDALAMGHLEIIWQAAYETGDEVIGTAADVEHLARWKGEANALASALLDAGFLDLHDDGVTMSVHDLFDHAPEYVQKRKERENARREKGKTLSGLRAEAGSKGGKAKRKPKEPKQLISVCLEKGKQTEANGVTPTPAPTPAPTVEEAPKQNGGELDPPWLARMFRTHHKGPKTRAEDEAAVAEVIGELIGSGVKPEAIRDEITRKDRRKSEPIWEFEKRLRAAQPTGPPAPTDAELHARILEQQRRNKVAIGAADTSNGRKDTTPERRG